MTQRRGSAYRQVFQHRSFRLFWFGFTFSVMGDMMTRVALTWFVYESAGSATALGWLNLFYTGPVVLGGLFAGWLLDRFDRRKVMLADSLLRGTVVAVIPLLHALNQLDIWHIYLVAAVYGSLMMVSLAGGPALVPDLVAKRDLATANALETLSFTLGGVLAPPLAGFLIARIGAPNVIMIDALSYAVFAWALANVALPRVAPEPPSPGQGLLPGRRQTGYGLRDAVQLLLKNKVLLSTTLMFMTCNIGMGFMFVWLPVLAGQMPGGGSELYGALLGFLAAGEVISSVLAGGLSPILSG
jgi:MFS family permease